MINRLNQRIGTYRLTQFLGEGTFGDVYLGEHLYQNTRVAVKVFKAPLTADQFKDFLNEIRTVLLRHPHIVQVLDFGVEESNIPYIVMDYAPNGTILHRHPRGTQLPLETIITYVHPIASALQYAHDQQLIHRDVKPENLLIDSNQQLLLGDFGIAVVAHHVHSQKIEEKSGTPRYMAPEQWQGKPVPATDQYALGIIVYEWITGFCPFIGDPLQLMYQHLHASPPSLQGQSPLISSEVEHVIFTALHKESTQRFPNVYAFAVALEKAVQEMQMQIIHIEPIQHENVPNIAHTSQLSLPYEYKKPETYPQSFSMPVQMGIAVTHPSGIPRTEQDIAEQSGSWQTEIPTNQQNSLLDGTQVLQQVKQGTAPSIWQVHAPPSWLSFLRSLSHFVALCAFAGPCVLIFVVIATLFHFPPLLWILWILFPIIIITLLLSLATILPSSKLIIMPDGCVYAEGDEVKIAFYYRELQGISCMNSLELFNTTVAFLPKKGQHQEIMMATSYNVWKNLQHAFIATCPDEKSYSIDIRDVSKQVMQSKLPATWQIYPYSLWEKLKSCFYSGVDFSVLSGFFVVGSLLVATLLQLSWFLCLLWMLSEIAFFMLLGLLFYLFRPEKLILMSDGFIYWDGWQYSLAKGGVAFHYTDVAAMENMKEGIFSQKILCTLSNGRQEKVKLTISKVAWHTLQKAYIAFKSYSNAPS